MVHSETMPGVAFEAESADESLYVQVFHEVRPRTKLEGLTVRYRRLANASSSIQWKEGRLEGVLRDGLHELRKRGDELGEGAGTP